MFILSGKWLLSLECAYIVVLFVTVAGAKLFLPQLKKLFKCLFLRKIGREHQC